MAITEGEGTLIYQNKLQKVKAGDCVWIHCHNPYSHESSHQNPWTLKWVHFYGLHAEDFFQYFLGQDYPMVFTPGILSSFTDILTNLYQVHEIKDTLAELVSNKLLTDLITQCFLENNPLKMDVHSTGNKIKQIRNYIELHFREKISLDSLSSRFFISKYHLSREFHKTYGITISSDITARRISHAKALLRFTSSTVEEVSIACGFLDVGYFIKVFKKTESLTPSEYRKKW